MTDVAKRCIGYVIAGALALGLLLWVSRKVDGWFGGNKDAATTAASKAQVKLHGSLLKIRAHLRQVETDKANLAVSFLAR
jgi:ferric-dicitrate binding protein FerR (iron transport regulator)